MTSFRETERKFVLLDSPMLAAMAGGEPPANCVLCYGYVDARAGLTFEAVAPVVKTGDAWEAVPTEGTTVAKFRAGSVKDVPVIPLEQETLREQYASVIQGIEQSYYTDPELLQARAVVQFDPFRHPEHPDDILVMFLKKDTQPERCWVRSKKSLGKLNGIDTMEGILLNRTNADFGYPVGGKVTFIVAIYGKGLVCAAFPK